MSRASFFSRTPLRHLVAVAFASITLWAAAAHAASDGLTISGSGYAQIIAGHPYSFTPTTRNPSGRKLVFSIVNKPAWASFSSSTGQLWGTPGIAYSPDWYSPIKISASDGVSTVALPQFGIAVKRPDTYPPVISGTAPTGVTVGTPYLFRPTAKDPAGNLMWFGVHNKPSWASFNSTTGQLAGTPTAANVGTYSNIMIWVSDGQKSASLPAFGITVKNGVISAGTGSATLSWRPPTENTNGSALTDLAGIRIHYGTSASSLGRVVQLSGAGQSSYTIGNLTTGTWYFATTAYAINGMESALSSVVSKSIP